MPPPLPVKGPTGGYFDLLPTPNPEELSFRVKEHAKDFKATQMPKKFTPYKSCTMLAVRPSMPIEGYSDYIYTHVTREGEYLWFHFSKSKTPSQKNTPFDSWTSTQQFTWPAMLLDTYIVKANGFPQATYDGSSVVTSSTFKDRYRYVPDTSYDSKIIIEQFLSPTPWSDVELTHPQPVPTAVNGDWVGLSVRFPRCLHPKIVFQESLPGAQIIYGQGAQMPLVPRDPTRQVFPATNFTAWAPFVISDQVQKTRGVYLREKVTIFPPPMPEDVRQ